jgi:hypothetical protein
MKLTIHNVTFTHQPATSWSSRRRTNKGGTKAEPGQGSMSLTFPFNDPALVETLERAWRADKPFTITLDDRRDADA